MKKTKAIVTVLTEQGRCLLNEIRGLKEGTVVTGTYDSVNRAFDFKWQGLDAVLWIGDNAELFHKRGAKTWRGKLREYILNLKVNQRIVLTPYVNIMYKGYCDECAHPVRIVCVGRYTKNRHCKLEDEFGQLFSLNDATEEECYNILHALPIDTELDKIQHFWEQKGY